MSLSMKVTTALLKLFPKPLETAETMQAALAKRPKAAPVPAKIRSISTVSSEMIQGREVITLSPQNPSGKEIIFTHGGAYVNPILRDHWRIIHWLMRATGARITVPDYGLAPEHTATEGYALLDEVYARVTRRASSQNIFLIGDSAGAGLALGQAIRIRDRGQEGPAAVFLFSPWLDVTMSNPEIQKMLHLDPMLAPAGLILAGQYWAGDIPVEDPIISPISADLAGLPPLYLYQGGRDIFLPDAKKLDQKAKAAGAPLELRIYPDGFHVYMAAPWTPEARETLNHVASIVRGTETSK